MLYYIVAMLILAADQLSKWWIVKNMQIGESISVIGEFFELYSHRNRGAAFGILQDQRWFFVAVTLVVLVGIVWYMQRMIRQGNMLLCWALGLLLGGALGNFIDRLRFGEVVDFLKFRFQFQWFGREVDYTYPIFNVADSAIVIAVGLILLDVYLSYRREKQERLSHERQQSELG